MGVVMVVMVMVVPRPPARTDTPPYEAVRQAAKAVAEWITGPCSR